MESSIFLKIMLTCFLLTSVQLKANTVCKLNPCEPGGEYDHWFTGPIFTPNPRALPPSHPALETVLISSCTYGIYDNNWKIQNIPQILSVGPYVDFQCSFNEIVGIEYIGSLASNFSQGMISTHLRDSIFRLGFQISRDRPESWIPDFRILLQETFPTGKYEKLNKRKKGTDLTGQGTFQTGIFLAFQKLFHAWETHCFSIRGDIGYFVASNVRIKGVNYYTGIYDADGSVFPGQSLAVFLTGELSLSSKLNIACETFFQYQRRGHFSGKIKDLNSKNQPLIKIRGFAQLTIVPEIEYTITSNLGLIFGSAVTLMGKNAPAFYSALLSALYVF